MTATTFKALLVLLASPVYMLWLEGRKREKRKNRTAPILTPTRCTVTHKICVSHLLQLSGKACWHFSKAQLSATLLQANLPECLQLVEVVDGFAVLRCKGLYEVQVTLDQRAYPEQVEEARQDAAAEAAKQLQEQQQQGMQEPGSSAAAEAAAKTAAEQQETAAAAQQTAATPAQPAKRWVWSMHYAVLLPNAAHKPPLQPEQMGNLLLVLKSRMETAVDAAAVEAARQQGKQEGRGEPAGASTRAASQSQQQSGPTSSQPTTSGMSTGATSTVSGMSQVSTAGRVDAGRGLDFKKYAADENMFPLMIMHGILRDVAAQLLLDESTAVAKRLAAAGSKWQGHLKLTRAEVLSPGSRMHYWQRVPVLLAAQPAGVTASSSKDGSASLPAIELGVGSDGTVQVLHLPPLRLPGSLQQVPLRFDSHAVDVEGLLIQAVAVTASTHLQLLRKAIAQAFQKRGLGHFVQLQLSNFGSETTAAAAAAGEEDQAAAAAGSTPGSSTAVAPGADAAAVPVGMPSSLVVSLDGHALVTVSFQPWSGKVVLRPGSVYGGNRNMEMGIQLQQVGAVLHVSHAGLCLCHGAGYFKLPRSVNMPTGQVVAVCCFWHSSAVHQQLPSSQCMCRALNASIPHAVFVLPAATRSVTAEAGASQAAQKPHRAASSSAVPAGAWAVNRRRVC